MSPAAQFARQRPERTLMELVLSLFPGIDLFGRGFELEGFCVVRGPDLLWDQKIEEFHVPTGKFDGVIAGPPCQNYSDANRRRNQAEGDRLLVECLRAIDESRPLWFLIENVRNVPNVQLEGYHVQRLALRHDDCGGRTRRARHFQFGCKFEFDGLVFQSAPIIIRPARTRPTRSVTGKPVIASQLRNKSDRHVRRCVDTGLYLPLSSLTPAARRRAVGNAVPLEMARVTARAVTDRSSVTAEDCTCLCGRRVTPPRTLATAACRQRVSRARRFPTRVVTL